MTYCIGWKTPDGVVLVADSAATMFGEVRERRSILGDRTSFGELQGEISDSGGKRQVREEILKTRVIGDSVAAIAGDAGLALNLLATIESAVELGQGYRQALQTAFLSSQPFSPDRSTAVLYAFYEKGAPQLLLLDTDHGGSIRDAGELVQIGSVGPDQVRHTERMVAALGKLMAEPPTPLSTAAVFTQLIALVQSYGVHDYVLADGVGGAFSGAWVTAAGASRQKSAFYVIHPRQPREENIIMCAVSAHSGALCLVNNTTGSSIGMSNVRQGESTAEARARIGRAVDEAHAEFDSAQFDFVVFINMSVHLISVFEMQRNRHHAYFYLDSFTDAKTARSASCGRPS